MKQFVQRFFSSNKILEVIIAIALTYGMYHCLRIGGVPRIEDGNNFPNFMFMSQTGQILPDQMPGNWKSRVLACKLSGWWMELWKPKVEAAYLNVFGSFNDLFFAGTCVLMICFLKEATLPMVGVFVSVLCCTPGFLAPYIMPWDLPTMMTYAAILILYRARLFWWMIPVIVIGSMIKETVLVTALFLLAAPWSKEPLATEDWFANPTSIKAWFNKAWTLKYNLIAIPVIVVFSQFLNTFLFDIAKQSWTYSLRAFSPLDVWKLWPVLFANAGAIVLMPLCLWRSKDWPLACVCAAFIVAQSLNDLMCGVFNELRDWLELAPLGWILISETIALKLAAPVLSQAPALVPRKPGQPGKRSELAGKK